MANIEIFSRRYKQLLRMLHPKSNERWTSLGRDMVPVRPGPYRRRSQLVRPQRMERPLLRLARKLRLILQILIKFKVFIKLLIK